MRLLIKRIYPEIGLKAAGSNRRGQTD